MRELHNQEEALLLLFLVESTEALSVAISESLARPWKMLPTQLGIELQSE